MPQTHVSFIPGTTKVVVHGDLVAGSRIIDAHLRREDPEALFNRACRLEMLGRTQDAERCLEEAFFRL